MLLNTGEALLQLGLRVGDGSGDDWRCSRLGEVREDDCEVGMGERRSFLARQDVRQFLRRAQSRNIRGVGRRRRRSVASITRGWAKEIHGGVGIFI